MSRVGGLGASESISLLRRAFPRNEAGAPVCAWDGKSRRANDALCYACWKSLNPAERAAYYDMDIYARAEWIIENKPKETR